MNHLVRVAEPLDTAPCAFVTFADDGTVIAANTTLVELLDYARDDVVGHHVERLFAVGTRIFYQTHWFPLLRLHGHAEEVFLMMRSRSGENIGMLSYAKRREDVAGGAYDCVLVRVRERARYEEELLRARRAAEESNDRLQAQQRELQQVNQQLEAQALELELQQQALREQTQLLEHTAADLRHSNAALQARSEEAEQLRALADEANQAKSAFLAAMSHELRTPLNAISGYLQILELEIRGPLNDAQHDIIARLEQSSRHLLRLINQVLNLARIEAGHIDYDIRDAAAAEIVTAIMPMIEPQFAARQIQFELDVHPQLMLRGDVDKVQQILLNLLSNAVKFTPSGGTVQLRALRSATTSANVQFEVHDTGIGIPADQLEAVFEPFVQVDSERARTVEGTGLGLAISRDLARGMKGDLHARSQVGAGSTFILTLPASDNPELAEPGAAPRDSTVQQVRDQSRAQREQIGGFDARQTNGHANDRAS